MEKIRFDHDEALELLKLMVSTNTVNGNEIILEGKLKELLEKEGLLLKKLSALLTKSRLLPF